MSVARRALLVLVTLAVASVAQAAPRPGKAPAGPRGVRPFLLTPAEAPARTFPRTPSFAWTPVRNAALYEFELATSDTFNEGSIVFGTNTLKTPAVSIPAALPWLTGKPYALYAHVRAIAPSGATSKWSAPYGFNLRWTTTPLKSSGAEYPGLVRWTPVDGASSYDVWFVDAAKVIRTKTTAADEREYYSFHQGSSWSGLVHWRVRAVRRTYGALPNFLPTVSSGPWSPAQTSVNPPLETGAMKDVAALSDSTSTEATPTAHRLTPGFAFSGNETLTGDSAPLYRVYVFSDADCVNVVFKGALVGSPAYAPRMSGPLALPQDTTALGVAMGSYVKDGLEGSTFTVDTARVRTTESDKAPKNDASGDGTPPPLTDPAATPPPAESTAPLPSTPTETGAPVDLWDTGWPSGRYYWTVVPAEWRIVGTTVSYHELDLPQDACAEGRVQAFGKTNEPAVTTSGAPFVTGLTPNGRLLEGAGKRPAVYGAPLVAWKPALGADQYQIQWSPTRYPWRPVDPLTKERYEKITFATPALLDRQVNGANGVTRGPLPPGTWWYRVRGLDFSLPGTARAMSWSDPVAVRVARPKFA